MHNCDFKIYKSDITDPCINLALEEYFMNTVDENEYIIFFWQSENAVVIGRNQNPYQECNISKLEQENVKLVRRLSGGGAVYHDLGNLNFSFIARSSKFDINDNFNIIISALKTLNIDSEFNGRNDLICGSRKFSGNAFINDDDKHLHHGTLLIDADITKISNYLTVSHAKLENKGFDSVKSRVLNLREVNSEISVNSIIEAITNYVSDLSNTYQQVIKIDELSSKDIEQYIKKYINHKWNYGDCPSFETKFEEKYDWGLISTSLIINEGKIDSIKIYTDALEVDKFDRFNKELIDVKLSLKRLEEIIKNSEFETKIKTDLLSYFLKHIFQ